MITSRRGLTAVLLAASVVGVGAEASAQVVADPRVQANQQIFAWICSTTVGTGAALDPGACAWNASGSQDPGLLRELPTRDATLTEFQQALWGCGPFFGTRCDGLQAVEVLPRRAYDGYLPRFVHAGGGIDFLNAEARALMQSWPSGVVRWTTLGTRRQPGTVPVRDPLSRAGGGVQFGRRSFAPLCTRPDGQGPVLTLPGCRGIESVFVSRNSDRGVTGITISFEDGYDPTVDGCLVGGGDRRNDPLRAIGNIGGVDVFLRPNLGGYTPDLLSIQSCHTQGPVGSDWLWHPLAGCLDQDGDCGSVWVEGEPVPRSFQDRFADLDRNGIPDIEQEFLGSLLRADCGERPEDCPMPLGRAQLFQNELAAISWNLLQFLVTTSCDEGEDGPEAIRSDTQCFDSGRMFAADKCSFNAPHLCRNVRSLQDGGIPVEIDVVPGSRRNRVKVRSRQLVAVAVLGSDTLPVEAIDAASLAFGPEGAAPVDRRGPRYRDVNDDGFLDLIAQYRIRETGLDRSDTEACLRGEVAGFAFEGCDAITTRGRRDDRDRDDDEGRARRDRDDDDDRRYRSDRDDRDDDRRYRYGRKQRDDGDRSRGKRSRRDD